MCFIICFIERTFLPLHFRRVKLLETKKRKLSSVLSRIPSIHLPFTICFFGMKSQKRPMQLSYLLFCSIAEQSMRLQSFAQWILPTPMQPFRDPGPSRISKLRLPPGAFLPSFLSTFSSYLPLLRSFFFFFFSRYEP